MLKEILSNPVLNCVLSIVVVVVIWGVAYVVMAARSRDDARDEVPDDEGERAAYNENMESAAFWAGANRYVDYDGQVVEL